MLKNSTSVQIYVRQYSSDNRLELMDWLGQKLDSLEYELRRATHLFTYILLLVRKGRMFVYK